MMGPSPSHIDEIVVVLKPRISTRERAVDRYDAAIYAAPHVPLGGLQSGQDGPPLDDMPLRATEFVKVRWAALGDMLKQFHDGERSGAVMRERLLEKMSPGLEELLMRPHPSSRRTRIWWSCQSPEVEELPWELLVAPGVSFVRGMPAPPRALLPRENSKLRVAVIARDPADIAAARLDTSSNDIDVTVHTDRVRPSLSTAIRDGADIIHLIADGSVLASWDAMLELRDDRLSPIELAAWLRGSRAVLLGISAAGTLGVDERGPDAYRAFSHVPSTVESVSALVQLGPWRMPAPGFREVYEELARTNSVETALQTVREQTPDALPIALFLRQRLGRELTTMSRATSPAPPPQQAQQHLKAARDLMQQLKAVEQRVSGPLDAPLSGSAAFLEEERNVSELDDALAPWTMLEESER